MTELFEAAFSTFNIIPTVILLFVLFYWILVILGALDISTFDFDLDVEADADLDMDFDGAAEGDISYLNYILKFFNIDRLPLMVFITCWIVPVWTASILANHYLGNTSFIFSLVILLPAMFGSLFVAKVVTIPFANFFTKLEDQAMTERDLVGHECTVVMAIKENRVGQAEMYLNDTYFKFDAKTKNEELDRDANAIIIGYDREDSCYILEAHYKLD